MERIGKFEKVSYDRFYQDWIRTIGPETDENCRRIYSGILLPRRATTGSAGYDFFLPAAVNLAPGETVNVPTGIRVRIAPGWLLAMFPRSGLGFRYRLQLNNTVGIIDADYYGSDNEGHIFAKITNDSNEGKTVSLEAGAGFLQGIFLPFGITEDDQVTAERNGGLGSTDRRQKSGKHD